MIRIIGIGSPFGADAAGLEAGQRLAESPPPGATVLLADRPGAGLIDLIDGAEAILILDAVRSSAPAGTLHDFDLQELPARDPRLLSSHALGVASALGLAQALGRRPERGRILGIEVGGCADAGSEVSLERGIDAAVARARLWVARWQHPRTETG